MTASTGPYDLPHLAGAFGAALFAGAINSVAGGGTLISFPILVALGLPPVIANATNTVGIWPGSVGSILGFREELRRVPRQIFWLLIPAVFGSISGALILRFTSPDIFNHLVPWLILFATVLFMVQAPIQKRLRSVEAVHAPTKLWFVLALFGELCVAIYGGYWAAGFARKIGKIWVRRFVIVVGLVIAVVMFVRLVR